MRKFITRSFVLAAAVSSIAVASVIGPASHGGTLADDSNANNPKRPVLADDSNANNPKRPVIALA